MASKPKAPRSPAAAKASAAKAAPPRLNPYLGFDGTCAEAFRFYEEVLGGKIVMMMTYADMPAGQGPPPTPETAKRIMHARLMVGDVPLMGGDAPPHIAAKPQGMTVNISVDTPAEADRIFEALSSGGTVTMPIGETFWARRFGMLTDRYGTPWMVNCEKPMA
jgi:PhnB protein